MTKACEDVSQFVPSVHCLLHPLTESGYQFWSGIGSDFGELTLITGLAIGAWRVRKHMECHVESPKNCRRIGRLVPGTGHRACRLHHKYATEKGEGNITAEVISCHADQAKAAYVSGSMTIPELEQAIENAIRHERQAEDRELGDS